MGTPQPSKDWCQQLSKLKAFLARVKSCRRKRMPFGMDRGGREAPRDFECERAAKRPFWLVRNHAVSEKRMLSVRDRGGGEAPRDYECERPSDRLRGLGGLFRSRLGVLSHVMGPIVPRQRQLMWKLRFVLPVFHTELHSAPWTLGFERNACKGLAL